jgi:hypothetical protein
MPHNERQARRSGVRRLALSSITFEEPTKPAQEPPIPTIQLQPSHADIVRAEDALRPRRVVRNGKSRPAPKKHRKPLVARQRYGLTRAEVAELLDKPDVTKDLPPTLCRQYRSLAARNITMGELAETYRVDSIAMEAIVEGWESDIVAKTCELYPRFHPQGTEPLNDRLGERAENEDEIAQGMDLAKSGGKSIGGRVVTGGTNSKGRPKKLFDFERHGQLTTTGYDPGRDRSGSKISEEDNYSENSGDDITRSE